MKDEIKLFKSELAFFEQEKERLKQKDIDLIELEKKIFEKSREIEDKRQKRIEAENNLRALEEKRIERENLIKEIDKANLVISTKKEQYSSILKELKEANELVLSQKEIFNEEELANAINEIKSIKEAIEVIQNELFNLKGNQKAIEQGFLETIQKKDRIFKMDICPTCLQDVSEVYKHNILNEAEKKEVELKKQREVLSLKEQQLNAPLEELNKKLSDFEKKRLHLEVLKAKQSDVERALKQQQILEQKKSAHEKDIDLLDKHLVGLKENLLTFSTFEITLNKHQFSLKEALSCEKQEEINLARLQKEKELTQKEKEELHKLLKEREGIRKKITALEEMSHWLSNNFTNLISFIEQQILLKLRYEFSRLFKKWFAILVSENFEIHLDENFSPVISHNSVEMEYSFLSGGERTAVALAYRLALNQTINSVFSRIKTKDILILDEPTEGFSSSQISKMREIFEELDIGQLIIVSHETQIEDFVENILKLKKENNLSVIEKSSS
jgi:exonuclease SbcC